MQDTAEFHLPQKAWSMGVVFPSHIEFNNQIRLVDNTFSGLS